MQHISRPVFSRAFSLLFSSVAARAAAAAACELCDLLIPPAATMAMIALRAAGVRAAGFVSPTASQPLRLMLAREQPRSPCCVSSTMWLCTSVHRLRSAGEATAVRTHDRHSRCRLQLQRRRTGTSLWAASFSTGSQRVHPGTAYALFGLRPGASFEDIQKQFRKQVGRWVGVGG